MGANGGDIVARAARHFGGARKVPGGGYLCKCPCHDDHEASLTIHLGRNGSLVMRCHAGCDQAVLFEAVRSAGLLPEMAKRPFANGHAKRDFAAPIGGKQTIVATYDYVDEAGVLIHQNVRCQPKRFYQRRKARPDDDPKTVRNGWVNSASGLRRVLFRLPEVLTAIRERATVFVCEGEKDVLRLVAEGLAATTNSAGAGNWTADHAASLAGANVVILEDNDPAGRKRSDAVAASLVGVAASIRVVRFPDLAEHGDVSDWLDQGGDGEALCKLADDAPEWSPTAQTDARLAAGGEQETEAQPEPEAEPEAGKSDEPEHVPLVARSVWDILERDPGERSWHIPDWLPGDDVSGMFADGGEGKTQFGLQLAYCTSIGFPIAGLTIERPGPACYLSAEEPERELDYRVHKIANANPLPYGAQRHAFEIVSRARDDAALCRATRSGTIYPTRLWGELIERVSDLRLKLLVLDAVADIYGGDENDRTQVRSFIAMLRRVANDHDVAVLLMGHPSRDGMRSGLGYSGSTAWHNSMRARWYFSTPRAKTAEARPWNEPDEEEGEEVDKTLRELLLAKTNRGQRGAKIMLRWSNGYFVTAAGSDVADAERMAAAKSKFVDMLREYLRQGRNVSHSKGPTFAPSLFAKDPLGKGISSKLYGQAMNLLLGEKTVRIVVEGPPSKQRSRLDLG